MKKATELIKNFAKGAISDGQQTLDPVDDIILLCSAVDMIPTADVVEVVRCKDCKYKHITSDCRVMCKRYAKKSELNNEWYGLTATDDNHFCSYGERKPPEGE